MSDPILDVYISQTSHTKLTIRKRRKSASEKDVKVTDGTASRVGLGSLPDLAGRNCWQDGAGFVGGNGSRQDGVRLPSGNGSRHLRKDFVKEKASRRHLADDRHVKSLRCAVVSPGDVKNLRRHVPYNAKVLHTDGNVNYAGTGPLPHRTNTCSNRKISENGIAQQILSHCGSSVEVNGWADTGCPPPSPPDEVDAGPGAPSLKCSIGPELSPASLVLPSPKDSGVDVNSPCHRGDDEMATNQTVASCSEAPPTTQVDSMPLERISGSQRFAVIDNGVSGHLRLTNGVEIKSNRLKLTNDTVSNCKSIHSRQLDVDSDFSRPISRIDAKLGHSRLTNGIDAESGHSRFAEDLSTKQLKVVPALIGSDAGVGRDRAAFKADDIYDFAGSKQKAITPNSSPASELCSKSYSDSTLRRLSPQPAEPTLEQEPSLNRGSLSKREPCSDQKLKFTDESQSVFSRRVTPSAVYHHLISPTDSQPGLLTNQHHGPEAANDGPETPINELMVSATYVALLKPVSSHEPGSSVNGQQGQAAANEQPLSNQRSVSLFNQQPVSLSNQQPGSLSNQKMDPLPNQQPGHATNRPPARRFFSSDRRASRVSTATLLDRGRLFDYSPHPAPHPVPHPAPQSAPYPIAPRSPANAGAATERIGPWAPPAGDSEGGRSKDDNKQYKLLPVNKSGAGPGKLVIRIAAAPVGAPQQGSEHTLGSLAIRRGDVPTTYRGETLAIHKSDIPTTYRISSSTAQRGNVPITYRGDMARGVLAAKPTVTGFASGVVVPPAAIAKAGLKLAANMASRDSGLNRHQVEKQTVAMTSTPIDPVPITSSQSVDALIITDHLPTSHSSVDHLPVDTRLGSRPLTDCRPVSPLALELPRSAESISPQEKNLSIATNSAVNRPRKEPRQSGTGGRLRSDKKSTTDGACIRRSRVEKAVKDRAASNNRLVGGMSAALPEARNHPLAAGNDSLQIDAADSLPVGVDLSLSGIADVLAGAEPAKIKSKAPDFAAMLPGVQERSLSLTDVRVAAKNNTSKDVQHPQVNKICLSLKRSQRKDSKPLQSNKISLVLKPSTVIEGKHAQPSKLSLAATRISEKLTQHPEFNKISLLQDSVADPPQRSQTSNTSIERSSGNVLQPPQLNETFVKDATGEVLKPPQPIKLSLSLKRSGSSWFVPKSSAGQVTENKSIDSRAAESRQSAALSAETLRHSGISSLDISKDISRDISWNKSQATSRDGACDVSLDMSRRDASLDVSWNASRDVSGRLSGNRSTSSATSGVESLSDGESSSRTARCSLGGLSKEDGGRPGTWEGQGRVEERAGYRGLHQGDKSERSVGQHEGAQSSSKNSDGTIACTAAVTFSEGASTHSVGVSRAEVGGGVRAGVGAGVGGGMDVMMLDLTARPAGVRDDSQASTPVHGAVRERSRGARERTRERTRVGTERGEDSREVARMLARSTVLSLPNVGGVEGAPDAPTLRRCARGDPLRDTSTNVAPELCKLNDGRGVAEQARVQGNALSSPRVPPSSVPSMLSFEPPVLIKHDDRGTDDGRVECGRMENKSLAAAGVTKLEPHFGVLQDAVIAPAGSDTVIGATNEKLTFVLDGKVAVESEGYVSLIMPNLSDPPQKKSSRLSRKNVLASGDATLSSVSSDLKNKTAGGVASNGIPLTGITSRDVALADIAQSGFALKEIGLSEISPARISSKDIGSKDIGASIVSISASFQSVREEQGFQVMSSDATPCNIATSSNDATLSNNATKSRKRKSTDACSRDGPLRRRSKTMTDVASELSPLEHLKSTAAKVSMPAVATGGGVMKGASERLTSGVAAEIPPLVCAQTESCVSAKIERICEAATEGLAVVVKAEMLETAMGRTCETLAETLSVMTKEDGRKQTAEESKTTHKVIPLRNVETDEVVVERAASMATKGAGEVNFNERKENMSSERSERIAELAADTTTGVLVKGMPDEIEERILETESELAGEVSAKALSEGTLNAPSDTHFFSTQHNSAKLSNDLIVEPPSPIPLVKQQVPLDGTKYTPLDGTECSLIGPSVHGVLHQSQVDTPGSRVSVVLHKSSPVDSPGPRLCVDATSVLALLAHRDVHGPSLLFSDDVVVLPSGAGSSKRALVINTTWPTGEKPPSQRDAVSDAGDWRKPLCSSHLPSAPDDTSVSHDFVSSTRPPASAPNVPSSLLILRHGHEASAIDCKITATEQLPLPVSLLVTSVVHAGKIAGEKCERLNGDVSKKPHDVLDVMSSAAAAGTPGDVRDTRLRKRSKKEPSVDDVCLAAMTSNAAVSEKCHEKSKPVSLFCSGPVLNSAETLLNIKPPAVNVPDFNMGTLSAHSVPPVEADQCFMQGTSHANDVRSQPNKNIASLTDQTYTGMAMQFTGSANCPLSDRSLAVVDYKKKRCDRAQKMDDAPLPLCSPGVHQQQHKTISSQPIFRIVEGASASKRSSAVEHRSKRTAEEEGLRKQAAEKNSKTRKGKKQSETVGGAGGVGGDGEARGSRRRASKDALPSSSAVEDTSSDWKDDEAMPAKSQSSKTRSRSRVGKASAFVVGFPIVLAGNGARDSGAILDATAKSSLAGLIPAGHDAVLPPLCSAVNPVDMNLSPPVVDVLDGLAAKSSLTAAEVIHCAKKKARAPRSKKMLKQTDIAEGINLTPLDSAMLNQIVHCNLTPLASKVDLIAKNNNPPPLESTVADCSAKNDISLIPNPHPTDSIKQEQSMLTLAKAEDVGHTRALRNGCVEVKSFPRKLAKFWTLEGDMAHIKNESSDELQDKSHLSKVDVESGPLSAYHAAESVRSPMHPAVAGEYARLCALQRSVTLTSLESQVFDEISAHSASGSIIIPPGSNELGKLVESSSGCKTSALFEQINESLPGQDVESLFISSAESIMPPQRAADDLNIHSLEGSCLVPGIPQALPSFSEPQSKNHASEDANTSVTSPGGAKPRVRRNRRSPKEGLNQEKTPVEVVVSSEGATPPKVRRRNGHPPTPSDMTAAKPNPDLGETKQSHGNDVVLNPSAIGCTASQPAQRTISRRRANSRFAAGSSQECKSSVATADDAFAFSDDDPPVIPRSSDRTIPQDRRGVRGTGYLSAFAAFLRHSATPDIPLPVTDTVVLPLVAVAQSGQSPPSACLPLVIAEPSAIELGSCQPLFEDLATCQPLLAGLATCEALPADLETCEPTIGELDGCKPLPVDLVSCLPTVGNLETCQQPVLDAVLADCQPQATMPLRTSNRCGNRSAELKADDAAVYSKASKASLWREGRGRLDAVPDAVADPNPATIASSSQVTRRSSRIFRRSTLVKQSVRPRCKADAEPGAGLECPPGVEAPPLELSPSRACSEWVTSLESCPPNANICANAPNDPIELRDLGIDLGLVDLGFKDLSDDLDMCCELDNLSICSLDDISIEELGPPPACVVPALSRGRTPSTRPRRPGEKLRECKMAAALARRKTFVLTALELWALRESVWELFEVILPGAVPPRAIGRWGGERCGGVVERMLDVICSATTGLDDTVAGAPTGNPTHAPGSERGKGETLKEMERGIARTLDTESATAEASSETAGPSRPCRSRKKRGSGPADEGQVSGLPCTRGPVQAAGVDSGSGDVNQSSGEPVFLSDSQPLQEVKHMHSHPLENKDSSERSQSKSEEGLLLTLRSPGMGLDLRGDGLDPQKVGLVPQGSCAGVCPGACAQGVVPICANPRRCLALLRTRLAHALPVLVPALVPALPRPEWESWCLAGDGLLTLVRAVVVANAAGGKAAGGEIEGKGGMGVKEEKAGGDGEVKKEGVALCVGKGGDENACCEFGFVGGDSNGVVSNKKRPTAAAVKTDKSRTNQRVCNGVAPSSAARTGRTDAINPGASAGKSRCQAVSSACTASASQTRVERPVRRTRTKPLRLDV